MFRIEYKQKDTKVVQEQFLMKPKSGLTNSLSHFLPQVQLGRQVLRASAHQTPHRDDRRVHDTQLAVAGQEGKLAEQKGHGAGHLKRSSRSRPIMQHECDDGTEQEEAHDTTRRFGGWT